MRKIRKKVFSSALSKLILILNLTLKTFKIDTIIFFIFLLRLTKILKLLAHLTWSAVNKENLLV